MGEESKKEGSRGFLGLPLNDLGVGAEEITLPILAPTWRTPTLEAYLCHHLPGGPGPVLSPLSHRGSVGGRGVRGATGLADCPEKVPFPGPG